MLFEYGNRKNECYDYSNTNVGLFYLQFYRTHQPFDATSRRIPSEYCHRPTV